MSAFVVVIVGTGTNVGKTHVCQALLACAEGRAAAWKPIESGATAESSDTHALSRAGPTHPPVYSFTEPISPHLAARRQGVVLDHALVVERAARHAVESRVFLIETAGGLFSPLDVKFTNADLVLRLAPNRVLLVAPDRLGVLNDVGATVGAARAFGLRIDALVLSAPEHPDPSTGTNRDELEGTVGIRVVAVFPWAPFDATASLGAARETLDALQAPASIRPNEDSA